MHYHTLLHAALTRMQVTVANAAKLQALCTQAEQEYYVHE